MELKIILSSLFVSLFYCVKSNPINEINSSTTNNNEVIETCDWGYNDHNPNEVPADPDYKGQNDQIYVRIQEDFDNEFVSCTSPVSSEHPALLRLLCIAGFKTYGCDEQPLPDQPCMLDVLFSNSGPGKEILSALVEGATGYGSLGKISIGVKSLKVIGTCCLKIYEKEKYQGISQSIPVGFEGAPNFPNIRSIKFGHCSSVVNHDVGKRSAEPSAEPEVKGEEDDEAEPHKDKRSAEAEAEADPEGGEPEAEAEADPEIH